MSSFNPQVITKKGEELVARALAEDGTIHWTRVALGDGTPGGNTSELEELVSPKLDAILINSTSLGETSELIAKFSNENISEEFDIRELGIFGKIDGDTESILYSYSIANDYSRVPINSNPFEMEWSIYTQVTNGDKINVSINPALQMLNKETADLFYIPVGWCQYGIGDHWITDSMENPATKWVGTTWEKLEGRVLLGTSSGFALGTEGGSFTVTLTKDNLPDIKLNTDEHIHTEQDHKHFIANEGNSTTALNAGSTLTRMATNYGSSENYGLAGSSAEANIGNTNLAGGGNTGAAAPMTETLGSGAAINIMNPFRATNIWRRTA